MILNKALRLTAAIASVAAAVAVCVVAAAFSLYAVVLNYLGPAGAAAVVAVVAAAIAGVIALVMLRRANPKPPKHADLPMSSRLFEIARERPILAVGAAVAGGLILLRNPKLLATAMTAAMAGRAAERSERRWGR